MTCTSCKKVLHYAHPDFHVIMPVVLAAEHKKNNELTEEGWTHVAGLVRKRINDSYALPDHEKVPSIPLDWVLESNHAVLRGAVEGDANVVIIDAIDTLNKESANSMLKLLEEPPSGTVMLLLTDRISALLPTIVSRCQILRFSFLSPEELRSELCSRLSIEPSDSRLEDLVHTGSLGRSLHLFHHPPGEVRDEAIALWEHCGQGNWTECVALIDRLVEWDDFARYEQLFMEFAHLVRNAFLGEPPRSGNVFLGDRPLAGNVTTATAPEQADRLLRECHDSIAAVKARGNMTLVLVNFATALMEALHGKEQQVG
jgi:DNA polymerase-3 subunit delta'